jgi:hypothetical protein
MAPIHRSSSELAATNALMIQLLEWLSAGPRTYGEAMEAWRTSCPRMPAWEDALDGGFIQVLHIRDTPMNECAVELTPLGIAVLARHNLTGPANRI